MYGDSAAESPSSCLHSSHDTSDWPRYYSRCTSHPDPATLPVRRLPVPCTTVVLSLVFELFYGAVCGAKYGEKKTPDGISAHLFPFVLVDGFAGRGVGATKGKRLRVALNTHKKRYCVGQ